MIPENVRAWIYRVAIAAIPVLTGYGVLSADKAALWLGLLGAILGTGVTLLASVHTSTTPARDTEDYPDI